MLSRPGQVQSLLGQRAVGSGSGGMTQAARQRINIGGSMRMER